MLEAGASLIEVLLKSEASKTTKPKTAIPKKVVDVSNTEATCETVRQTVSSHDAKLDKKTTSRRRKPNQKVIDRRRRRGQRLASSGSSSEDEEEVHVCKRSSSDSSLSMPSDDQSEEDIQVLESLSENSASDDEQRSNKLAAPGLSTSTTVRESQHKMDSPKPRPSGRRQIVLAANFNLVPSSADESRNSSSEAPMAIANEDSLLKEVYSETIYQSVVHTSCSILAEDPYFALIKVFTEWLHNYSIVIATCRQVHVQCS